MGDNDYFGASNAEYQNQQVGVVAPPRPAQFGGANRRFGGGGSYRGDEGAYAKKERLFSKSFSGGGGGGGSGGGGGYHNGSSSSSSAVTSGQDGDANKVFYLSEFYAPAELEPLRDYVLHIVARGGSKRDILPGPMPKTVSRSDLQYFAHNKYWVSEKSDGERRMLLIQKDAAYMMDRSFRFRRILSDFYHTHLWTGGDTLLDGEVLGEDDDEDDKGDGENDEMNSGNKQRRVVFSAYDSVMVDGVKVDKENLCKRLMSIAKLVGKFRHASKDYQGDLPFQIVGKEFYEVKVIKQKILSRILKDNKNRYVFRGRHGSNLNDGLIFTPNDDTFMQDKKMLLKWKWPEMNSIDFKVKAPYFDRDGKMTLLCKGPGRAADVVCRRVGPYNAEERARLKRQFETSGRDYCIAEFVYQPSTNPAEATWHVERIRADKRNANFISTVMSTIQVIVDDVSLNELVDHLLRKQQPPPHMQQPGHGHMAMGQHFMHPGHMGGRPVHPHMRSHQQHPPPSHASHFPPSAASHIPRSSPAMTTPKPHPPLASSSSSSSGVKRKRAYWEDDSDEDDSFTPRPPRKTQAKSSSGIGKSSSSSFGSSSGIDKRGNSFGADDETYSDRTPPHNGGGDRTPPPKRRRNFIPDDQPNGEDDDIFFSDEDDGFARSPPPNRKKNTASSSRFVAARRTSLSLSPPSSRDAHESGGGGKSQSSVTNGGAKSDEESDEESSEEDTGYAGW